MLCGEQCSPAWRDARAGCRPPERSCVALPSMSAPRNSRNRSALITVLDDAKGALGRRDRRDHRQFTPARRHCQGSTGRDVAANPVPVFLDRRLIAPSRCTAPQSSSFRAKYASAYDSPHSTPRRRSIAQNVSSLNQCLPAWVAKADFRCWILHRQISAERGT